MRAKNRSDRRQIDFDDHDPGLSDKPDFEACRLCEHPRWCSQGKGPCDLTGEFMAGPLKGKLPCEVQGPPVWTAHR